MTHEKDEEKNKNIVTDHFEEQSFFLLEIHFNKVKGQKRVFDDQVQAPVLRYRLIFVQKAHQNHAKGHIEICLTYRKGKKTHVFIVLSFLFSTQNKKKTKRNIKIYVDMRKQSRFLLIKSERRRERERTNNLGFDFITDSLVRIVNSCRFVSFMRK